MALALRPEALSGAGVLLADPRGRKRQPMTRRQLEVVNWGGFALSILVFVAGAGAPDLLFILGIVNVLAE